MLILTAEQMRRIDERTERDHGIRSETLMDNAGREIASALLRRYPDLESRRTIILCGRGNNGGDGITAARHLRALGVNARVVLLCGAEELKGAAAWAFQKTRSEGIAIEEIREDADWGALRRRLPEHDVIVDALLGTGTRGAAAGRMREAIEAINGAGSDVVSVDIPSGLNASEPTVPGACVEADFTIALAARKVAHVFPPACRYSGRVEVADIGIPGAAFAAENVHLQWAAPSLVAPLIPVRDPSSHKGDYGHVLIVAGSRGKSGAAILMARACLRSGAGLVTVASPASVQPLIAACVVEAMTEALPETSAGTLARRGLPILEDLAAARDVLAAGPGLGTDPETAEVVRALVTGAGKPMILDADALNILAAERGSATSFRAPAILTPHPGEAGRLLGIRPSEVQADRIAAARKIASDWGACTLLKGDRTLVADPSGLVRVNATGNAGMATGGSGDVLSGIVAAWLAQGLSPLDAGTLAAHVHGLAGDLAAADLGEISVTAGDLVEHLPRAYRALAAPRRAVR